MLLAIAATFLLTRWFAREPSAPRWSADQLSGPEIAFNPRRSPDGRLLAFQAMVDGQTQVAVMDPESGNWNVLTRRRDQGIVQYLCWSTDGSTIYLPVWNEGALFSTRDGHAAQGDGEVNGTAIETALTGTFELRVRRDLHWKLPRAETATHLITFGLDADLDDAARQALHEMIDWIAAITGISRDEAYSLSSFAVDLHVTQTVNNVKGVHAMIERSILRPA